MAQYIRKITGAAGALATIACTSPTDLANVRINSVIVPGVIADVLGTGLFAWDPTSSASPSSTVIQPLDGTNPGRWLSIATGGGGANPIGPAGGNLSGTYPNPIVAQINSASVPAAGSLTIGNVLQVTGASALGYAPVNLAGGSNFVTGTLPVGNGGTGLNSIGAANTALVVNGAGTAAIWQLIVDANVSGAAAIAGTKISPNFGSQNVVTTGTITGASYVVSASGPTITTGTAAPSSSEVDGSIYLRNTSPNGSIYIRTSGAWVLLATAAGTTPTGAAGGDLGGSYPNPDVLKIHGATVPIAGSLTTGNVLQVAGGSALSYAAVNLAGGSNFVTGTLPVGNGGTGLNSAGAANTALVMDGTGTNATWALIVNANVSASAAIAGTKISPNFGSQNIVTTGTITGGSYVVTSGGPTITTGSAIPSSSEVDGSIYLRNTSPNGTIYLRANGAWIQLATAAGTTPTGAAGGDLSGTYPNPSVAKVNGASVPAAGALTTGNVLQVTGVSTLGYAPVNLAGGANFVTGTLPAGNGGTGQTGVGAANTVLVTNGAGSATAWATIVNANVSASAAIAGTKISPDFGSQNVVTTGTITGASYVVSASGPTITTGTTVPVSSQPDGSIYLRNTSPNGSVYVRVNGAWVLMSTSTSSSPTGAAGGDLAGTYPNPIVIALTGTANIVAVHGTTINWDATSSTPTITQARATSAGQGQTFSIIAQQSQVGSSTGGNILVRGGSGDTITGTAQILGGQIVLTSSSGGGSQGIYTDANNLVFRDNGQGPVITWVLNSAGATSATIALGATSPTFSQANNVTNGATAQSLTWQAQNATGTTSTGGSFIVKSGTGTTAAGSISLRVGATESLGLNPTGAVFTGLAAANDIITVKAAAAQTGNYFRLVDSTSAVDILFVQANGNLKWGSAQSPILSQVNLTSGTGATFLIQAQRSLSGTGGILQLQSGRSSTGGDASVQLMVGLSSALDLNATGAVFTGIAAANDMVTLKAASSQSGTYLRLVDSASADIFFIQSNGDHKWAATQTPTISQVNLTSGTGATFTLAAQRAITGTGGNLLLQSGRGSVVDGNVDIQTGTTSALLVSPTKLTLYGNPTVSTGSAAPSSSEPDGSLYLRNTAPNGSVYIRTNGVWVLLAAAGGANPTGAAGGDLGGTYPNPIVVGLTGVAGSIAVHSSAITWDVGASSPIITQTTTGGSTGQTLTIQSQTATTTGGTLNVIAGSAGTQGGNVTIRSGAGSITGSISLRMGSNEILGLFPSGALFTSLTSTNDIVTIKGAIGQTGSYLRLRDSSSNDLVAIDSVGSFAWGVNGLASLTQSNLASGTGSTFTIKAQRTLSGTGGTLLLQSGLGGPSGNIDLQNGSISALLISPTKFTLYGGPTVSTGSAVPAAAEVDGSFYLRNTSPNGSAYIRTNGTWLQLATTSGSGGAVLIGGAAGGDLSGTYPNPIVVGITGITGTANIHATTLQWDSTVPGPILWQQPTGSASGQIFAIQAQNATTTGGDLQLIGGGGTGGGSTGGNVIIKSGTGTSVNGFISLRNSSAEVVRITDTSIQFALTVSGPTILQAPLTSNGNGQTLTIKAQDGFGLGSSGGNVLIQGGAAGGPNVGAITLQSSNSTATFNINGLLLTLMSQIQWSANTGAPSISQAATSVASTNGQSLAITAQQANAVGTVGGALILSSGIGASAAGKVTINFGATKVLEFVSVTEVDVFVNAVNFAPTLSNIFIVQQLSSTNNAIGNTLNILAQNMTGTTSTGGKLVLNSGSGTSAPGKVTINLGATTVLDFVSVTQIDAFVNVINFAPTLTNIFITQQLSSTNGAIGHPLNILAQNMTGTTSTGGNLVLNSGSGTSAPGKVTINLGTTTVLDFVSVTQINAFVNAVNFAPTLTNIFLVQQSSSTNNATGNTFNILAQNMTGTTSTGGNLALTSGSGTSAPGKVTISLGATNVFDFVNTAQVNIGIPGLIFISSLFAPPVITQATTAVNSATANSLTLHAQNATGTTSVGGDLILGAGSGTSTNGSIKLNIGSNNKLSLYFNTTTSQDTFSWSNAATAPRFGIDDSTGAAVSDLVIAGQGAGTLANANGGDLLLSGGARSGSGLQGAIRLRTVSGNTLVSVCHTTGGNRVLGLLGSADSAVGANSGSFVMWVNDCATVPTASPSVGGMLYSEVGALKWRGTSGTITTLGTAEPHCPRCGRDFAGEWSNDKYGKLTLCFPCLIDALARAGISRDEYMIVDKLKS